MDWTKAGFYGQELVGPRAKSDKPVHRSLGNSALEIIQKNSHLIHDDDSRRILRNFLKAVAKQGMVYKFCVGGDEVLKIRTPDLNNWN